MYEYVAIVAALLVATFADASARADDAANRRVPVRTDESFELDAIVQQGWWLETSVEHQRLQRDYFGFEPYEVTYEFTSLVQTVAWGSGNFELTASIPVGFLEVDYDTASGRFDSTRKEQALGNLHFGAKAVSNALSLGESVRLTGGIYLGIQAPTSTNTAVFSDRFHIDGGLSGRLEIDPIVWQIVVNYTAVYDESWSANDNGGFDWVSYGTQLLVPFGERLLLRSEFAGEHFVANSTWFEDDDVRFEAGADYRVAAVGDGLSLILRVGGGPGLTTASIDWAFGGAVVLSFERGS